MKNGQFELNRQQIQETDQWKSDLNSVQYIDGGQK